MNTLQEIVWYTKLTLSKALTPTIHKAVVSAFMVMYAFFFDKNQTQAHIALAFLIIMDFITGVLASKISGEPIQSSKIRRTSIKFVAYFLVISGAHICQKALAWGLPVIDGSTITFFLVTELISLIENVGKMGYATPQKLLNQLKHIKDEQ